MKRMRDPLRRRLPRELKADLPRHLVIFLFFTLLIGAGSGYFISCDSLAASYKESFDKYTIEDGNLDLNEKASPEVITDIEKDADIRLYENFFKQEETADYESKLRMFGERKDIDRVCLLSGDMPSEDNEIGIDRLYAENHKLEKGSTITLKDGTELTVSGIVALSDYSCLYEDPSDLMFDNDAFGVGVLTDEGFAAIREDHLIYRYSWLYNTKPEDDAEAKEMSEELIKTVSKHAVLTGFNPEYVNQAIKFAGDDINDDRVGMSVFLFITIVILAFITAITADSTVLSEAGVIGTLRASGYSRREMLCHYLMPPMITLLAGAVVGNVLGYTLLESYMAKAYLGSYSLTTYEIRFNPEALLETTVLPFVTMLVINAVTIGSKLRLSPLRFIRRDLSTRKKKKALRLNTKIPIMSRFRMRIILQNLPNYMTIIFGSFLANFLLMFGMIFEPMLLDFQDTIADNMLSEYIYVLKAPAETSEPTAEKAVTTNLETTYEKYKPEQVAVYGICDNSRYVRIGHKGGVFISTAYADKYGIAEGDTITLKEKYADREYSFKVSGLYDYPATIAVFMDIDDFGDTFDDAAQIYFANNEITDIDDRLIASKIGENDLNKTSRQLMRSMGSIMNIFKYFGIIMFMIVIYLLAKIIIEKNARSISVTKILGYTDGEIGGLYVHSTTIVAILSIVCTVPLADRILDKVFRVIFMDYSGYFAYNVSVKVLAETILIGIVSYMLISVLLNRKVRKVDLAEALKNVE